MNKQTHESESHRSARRHSADAKVNHRIRAELLRLAYKHIDLDFVARIPNMPTHAQLAGRVSCHREAVSRELKLLEREGILAKRYGKVVIPDIARLQRKQTQDAKQASREHPADGNRQLRRR